jgi:hypothetical protein
MLSIKSILCLIIFFVFLYKFYQFLDEEWQAKRKERDEAMRHPRGPKDFFKNQNQ